MSSLPSLVRWSEENSEVFFDLIRVYLGIGLVIRGWLFLDSPTLLTESLSAAGAVDGNSTLNVVIAVLHIAGGLLLTIGFFTRLAALIQIPILFGAVFVVHLAEGLATRDQSLEFAALVLFLLIIIFLRGSGPLSVDQKILGGEPEAPPLPPDDPSRAEYPEPDTHHTIKTEDVEEFDLDDVRPKPIYNSRGWLAMVMGVRAVPVAVEFRDRETGEVLGRTKDPEVLAKYR